MTANVVPRENSALRLARYLKEFVGLRRTTVDDVAKYDSVLWFKDMPQENVVAWIIPKDALSSCFSTQGIT